MSKYDGLRTFLAARGEPEIPMTFADIERLIGVRLPQSARKHRPWWSNNPSNSVMTHAWLGAGYRTARVDMAGERLVFEKSAPLEPRAGFQEAPAPSWPTGCSDILADSYGALKGTVRFLPDVDLTEPLGEPWAAEH